MRLLPLFLALAITTQAHAADAPKPAPPPTAAELQTQLDAATAKAAQLQTMATLFREQRNTAQQQAADAAVDLYVATHPASAPVKDAPK